MNHKVFREFKFKILNKNLKTDLAEWLFWLPAQEIACNLYLKGFFFLIVIVVMAYFAFFGGHSWVLGKDPSEVQRR